MKFHILIFASLSFLLTYSTALSQSKILEIQKPGVKERVEWAGVIQLPKVSSRQIKLTSAQEKLYSDRYKNFKFTDESRFVRGIPLGVTGLYAMDSTKRQDLFVYHIEEESPAKDLVKINDIIVGVNGRLFEAFRDCRIVMGLSLTESQTTDLNGKLYLHLIRNGKFGTVTVDIGIEIPYAKTFPFNCQRSRKMAAKQIELIKKSFEPGVNATTRWWDVLMLMASDDPEAHMMARKVIYDLREPKVRKLASWYLGYELIMLCEYYLLTGDSTILASIEKYKKIVEGAQCPSGGWAHGGGPGGYGGTGEVNATGLTCLIGLVLAEKCQVKMNRERYEKSIKYFKRFRVGTVPYGNFPPKKYKGSNNGKAGMAAVAFNLLGDKETSRMFAEPSCYSFNYREGGHAEGLFNFAWGPLGAAFASPEEYQLFMNNQLWYYELGRKLNDSYTYLRGGRLRGTHLGGMGLFLMMPAKKLQILDAEESIFSIKPPKGAERAAQLYKEKNWTQFLKECKQVKSGTAADYVKRLHEAFERVRKDASFTIDFIKSKMSGRDVLEAKIHCDALEESVGSDWPGLAELKKKITTAVASLKPLPKNGRSPKKQNKRTPTLPIGYKSKRDWRRVVLNGWTPGADTISDEISAKMKNMPAIEVIRHAAHPHETFTMAALKQILLRKNECLPLIQELTKHKDPEYRAIAVRVLGYFESKTFKLTKYSRHLRGKAQSKKIDAELMQSISSVKALLNDPSEDVQLAITEFLNSISLINEDINEMYLKLSKSTHLEIITAVQRDCTLFVIDHESLYKIAMQILSNSEKFPVANVRNAIGIFPRLKDYDFSPRLEDLFKYLSDKALPREANAWDSSYSELFKLFQKYSNHPSVKNNIPLLCQFYVRKHMANHELRNLFAKMDRKHTASVIRAFITKEAQWLDNTIKKDSGKFQSHCFKEEYSRACLEELARLADDLEKGTKIDHAKYGEWAVKLKFGPFIRIRNEHLNPSKKKKRR